MTDYIKEMMKTAGVNYYDSYYSCLENKGLECKNECCICDKAKEVFYYPDFTPEKQLEMIKLISDTCGFHCCIDCILSSNKMFFGIKINGFTQALAQLTTELMEAGELNKAKVKGILKK